MATETIALSVALDKGAVERDLQNVLLNIRQLKEEQRELNKAIREGEDVDGAMAARLIDVNRQLELQTKESKALSATTRVLSEDTKIYGNSLDGERAKLSDMLRAFDALDASMRESDAGKAFQKQIDEQTNAVKRLEEATGRHGRNVGNYADSILQASSQMGGLGKATTAVINPIKNATVGLKAMSATPIIAILSVLITIIQKLAEKFKGNAAAMEKLTSLFGAFEGVGVLVSKVIDKLAEGVGWLADKLLKLADNLGLVSDEMKESQKIAEDSLALQKKERENAVANAKDTQRIAELRAQARMKDKMSAKERLKLMQEAADMEEEIARRQAELAKEQYELQVRKNAQSESSQEDLKLENDLYIKSIEAQSNYLNKQNELAAQMTEMRMEQREEEKQQAAVRLEIARAVEDALVKMDRDAVQRQVNQTRIAGEREVENLKVKLNNLKHEDLKAREDLQKLITAKETETQQKISDILIKATEEREAKARQIIHEQETFGITDRVALAQIAADEAQAELNRVIEITKEEKEVLFATEEDYQLRLLALQKDYADKRNAERIAEYKYGEQQRANEFEKRRIEAGEDAVQLAQIELEQAAIENEQLLAMDAELKAQLYQSDADYESALIESSKRVMQAQKANNTAMLNDAKQKASAIGSVMGSLSGILDQFAEENKDLAIASKGLALGQIAVQTGVAIAEGLAASQSVPFPANIAAIATTIGTILANIATAISTVKSAKFEDGGVVGGTSYTGDNMLIRANSGEVVLNNKQAGSVLYEMANNPARGGMDYGAMADAMAAAIESMPAPVMDFAEFTDFQQKTATYNEIASI